MDKDLNEILKENCNKIFVLLIVIIVLEAHALNTVRAYKNKQIDYLQSQLVESKKYR